MKYTFLRKNYGSSRLIIIMTGWSTGPRYVENLEIDGWDILVCYSYSDFNFPSEIISGYKTIYLFAWSLGIAAAEMGLNDIAVTASYAINGSPSPVSDTLGIPTDIFIGTAVGLSEKTLAKFHRRMCVSSSEYLNSSRLLVSSDTIPELRSQLLLFAKTKFKEPRLPWRRVYISSKDAIFPEENMRNFWEEYASHHNTEITLLDSGHLIDLVGLIRSHIADMTKVARSFSASHDRYVQNAIAQKQIAEHLATLIPDFGEKPISVLEVGPGAGLFTRIFRPILNISHLHLVDIYEISQNGYRSDETFILADAEKWIETVDSKWDLILSASSIQWFSDLKRFLNNVRLHLRHGGHLVCSTFLTGNLSQLDSLRPSPLLYHSRKEIEEILKETFDGYEVDTENITLSFDTPRKALLHLRDTGVAGVGASGKTVARIIKALTPADGEKVELTYRPIYIHAWVNPDINAGKEDILPIK